MSSFISHKNDDGTYTCRGWKFGTLVEIIVEKMEAAFKFFFKKTK